MTDSEIIDSLLAKEGGYVNHPADKGGPTNFGITQATLSQWLSRPVTIDEVKQLSVEVARDIYRTKYLQPFDHVDAELKPQVVDIAVNSGVSRAQQLLKQATDRLQVRPVGVQLVIERLEFYAKIVKANPSQSVFMLGWIRRATSFLLLVCHLLAGAVSAGSARAVSLPAMTRQETSAATACCAHRRVAPGRARLGWTGDTTATTTERDRVSVLRFQLSRTHLRRLQQHRT